MSLLSADAWNKVSSTEHPMHPTMDSTKTSWCEWFCPVRQRMHTSIRGTQFEAKFVVSSDLWVDGILGLDFIEQHDCVIDIVKKVLNFRSL